jgi:vacuolar protein sorting-associated protein 53
LDIAKKNLTTSITTLNHLQMLIEGVDKIESVRCSLRLSLPFDGQKIFRVAIKKKSYADIANLLHQVIGVLEHFQPYMTIPQIQDLSNK